MKTLHVENNLHWSLGVSLNEDLFRMRASHSSENLAIFKRIPFNLLKQ